MARKITKKDRISYICEKCNNEMFKFSVREKGLFTADDPFMFKKYLNRGDIYCIIKWDSIAKGIPQYCKVKFPTFAIKAIAGTSYNISLY